jgi:hypothetical protein
MCVYTYLHIAAPGNTERDKDIPDDLENLPGGVYPLVLCPVVILTDVTDELGPCCALGNIGIELDPCQEVIDGREVDEWIDGSKRSHLVKNLDALSILCAFSVDVDGECNVSIIHCMVELGGLISCIQRSALCVYQEQYTHTYIPGHCAVGMDKTGTTFWSMWGMARKAVWLESLPGLP